MDVESLTIRIQQMEEENHLLAMSFKETTSALLDRVRALEEEIKSARPEEVKARPTQPSSPHPMADQVRQALQTDDLGRFRKLIGQGFPLDSYFSDSGLYLIHESVKAGAMKIVNFLRSQNVNLNALTDQGDNVVTLAAELNQHDTLCVLLQHAKDRVNVEHVNKLGLTGIQIAVKNGLKDIVGLLSEHGANLQIVNGLGDTLIQMAQRAGHQDIVMLLVNVGAPLR